MQRVWRARQNGGLTAVSRFYSGLSETSAVLISLSLILLCGFLVTRVTKLLRLPNVTGYILAGVLIGPYILGAVPVEIIGRMGFVSDVALAFIAFGVGKFFKKEVLRAAGAKVIVITLSEALFAGVLMTVATHFLFSFSWSFSLILGAIATATAPASTMMTIRQYHARGDFVNTLLQVVALDDVVCLLAFGIVAAVAGSGSESGVAVKDVVLPLCYNLAAPILGFFCGFLLSKLLNSRRSRDNRLILVTAMLLGLSGLCSIFDVSPLLACMVFGAAYINLTGDKELYHQVDSFTPPVMSMFFVVSGMSLDIRSLGTAGVIGLAYFGIRIAGKYAGTYLSSLAVGAPKEVRNYLGLALIPQAGVAIGLAFLGQRLLPDEMGSLLLTIILSSSVLYELIGPAAAKGALFWSGAIHPVSTALESAAAPEPEKLSDASATVPETASDGMPEPSAQRPIVLSPGKPIAK